ncbi:MAG: response regulator [Candidatus Omnitrophica bacterium]|nr:response regulator [Candidatus Omnitrophota bacterium]
MSSNNRNIYIVDDDESVCRALKALLTTFDFEVKTFSSAKIFFEAVPNDEPGCLVLDIHMPGADGWDIQKQILNSGSNRPVIFISAEKQEYAADRALKVGAVGFLQKPFNGQTLVDLINLAAGHTNIPSEQKT